MSRHLLGVTVGPVQDFIRQARRTRDLWFGSHLLSELARAGARALAEAGAELVFPPLDPGDPELEPCDGVFRRDGSPIAPLTNELRAVLPEGTDPAETARRVREAIFRRWRGIAAEVKGKCPGLLAPGIDQVWQEQIETAPEFLASWAPLAGKYKDTRRRLGQAIAGRKRLRDFGQWRHHRHGAPKSSLDGGRVSVLAEVRPKDLVRKYRIAPGEQLDAVGLVKRAGGDPEQFPSIVTVALAAWITAAAEAAPEELARLRDRAQKLDLPRVNRPDLAWTKAFPFEASVLLESRVAPTFEELGISGDPAAFVRHELRPLYRKIGEPSPYVACLVADGDRMGKALDGLDDQQADRRFSKATAAFARKAREIVEQDHRGSLVYAGGDDVLAFLPVTDAVACAHALRRDFADAKLPVGEGKKPPTLSVGIGIGHVMEAMGDLLELGREAERLAKTKRNALAILLDKRSGGRSSWVASWDTDPVHRLDCDRRLVEDLLSVKKIHEIAAILRRLPEPAGLPQDEAEGFAAVLRGEVGRALARNEAGALSFEQVGLELPDNYGYGEMHEAVERWVDRLLIARAIAEARPRRRSEPRAEAA
jgi:CRISPR-associated protein Cmr2